MAAFGVLPNLSACSLLPEFDTCGNSMSSATTGDWAFVLDRSCLELPFVAFGELGCTDCSAKCSAMIKGRYGPWKISSERKP